MKVTVEHPAQPSYIAVSDGDSGATHSPCQPLHPRIVQIRDNVMSAAWWGAVAALEWGSPAASAR
jgi:hypothetical protein